MQPILPENELIYLLLKTSQKFSNLCILNIVWLVIYDICIFFLLQDEIPCGLKEDHQEETLSDKVSILGSHPYFNYFCNHNVEYLPSEILDFVFSGNACCLNGRHSCSRVNDSCINFPASKGCPHHHHHRFKTSFSTSASELKGYKIPAKYIYISFRNVCMIIYCTNNAWLWVQ